MHRCSRALGLTARAESSRYTEQELPTGVSSDQWFCRRIAQRHDIHELAGRFAEELQNLLLQQDEEAEPHRPMPNDVPASSRFSTAAAELWIFMVRKTSLPASS